MFKGWFSRKSRKGAWRVAINVKPINESWGGQNQFVLQLVELLQAGGHEVVFDLDRKVTHVLLLSVYDYETVTFLPEEVARFKKRNQGVRVIHRINDNDIRKNTDHVDRKMIEANETADMTVYISGWLKDYFIEKGIPEGRPYRIIHNAVDDRYFYPRESIPDEDRLWLVTHHWSDNWMKGFHEYVEVDRMISEGELPGVGFRVIGKWPEGIEWRSAETYPPMHGPELAGALRKNHLYITASRWEPGGMHFIEGLQCGLPTLYHLDGGGINEVAEKFGWGFRDDLREVIKRAASEFQDKRQGLLDSAERPSGKKMCQAFLEVMSEQTPGS